MKCVHREMADVVIELLNSLPDTEDDLDDISWSVSWDYLSNDAQERVKVARKHATDLLAKIM